MGISLYRKYRPQKFSQVVNQNHIVISLTNQLKDDSITQAYLFSGPRGLGKTTIARLFAKSLNCQKRAKGQHEPCGSCDSCQNIINNNSLDIIEIDAASHTGVDNVRENIIATSRTQVGKDRYKVFIIDEVHMLSLQAFNALLKTIEEPPAHVIFVLATTEIHKVPATIISRCQRYDFKKVTSEDIVKRLKYILKQEKREVDDDVLKLIAIQSEGCIRDSESLLDQILSLGLKKINMKAAELMFPSLDIEYLFNYFKLVLKKDTKKALELIGKMSDEGIEFSYFLEKLIDLLHKSLLFKIEKGLVKDSLDFDPRQEKQLMELLENVEAQQIVSLIYKFLEKESIIKDPVYSQIAMEILTAEITLGAIAANTVAEASGADTHNPVITKELADNKTAKPKGNELKVEMSQNENQKLSIFTNKWNDFLNLVKKHNHSLAFILRVSKPIDFVSNKLKLGVKYKIHQEKINEKKVHKLLEKLLSEVSGEKVKVECVLDTSKENEDQKKGETKEKKDDKTGITSKIINVFGGKIVEEK